MKKILFLSKIVLSLILSSLFFSINPIYAQSDFSMFLGNTINDTQIDGIIEQEWDDVTSYPNIEINPNGNAQIWIKHDQNNLYIAIQFQADSDNPWVALQLGNTNCMTSNTDGALFGDDTLSPNGYQDIYFGGLGTIKADSIQDGVGAIKISNTNMVTIELKKPLNDDDAEGKDIQWSNNNEYSIVIMWDSDGNGSSGGSTNHRSTSPIARTININPEAIPEYSTLTIPILLITLTIPLILSKKKTKKTN